MAGKSMSPDFEDLMDDQLLDIAETFALDHEDFDDTFVVSLRAQFETKGELTERQRKGLENIIEKWKMQG